MEKYILHATLILALTLEVYCIPYTSKSSSDCICPLNYNPVCGIDGRTYGNMCALNCARVPLAYRGECRSNPSNCICPRNYDPVCGIDGRTYGNKCMLKCAGVPLAYRGECNTGCACPYNYDPVCGIDGRTYPNLCSLRCAGVPLAYRGECQNGQSCPCPYNYDPVCGVNGRTYPNLCSLQCVRVPLLHYGECEICSQSQQVVCIVNPCFTPSCPRFPYARCVDGCNCRARYFVGRQEVTALCGGRKRVY